MRILYMINKKTTHKGRYFVKNTIYRIEIMNNSTDPPKIYGGINKLCHFVENLPPISLVI